MPRRDYAAESAAQFFRVRFRTLDLPTIRDGVVIGRTAPISADAMMQTLRLVSTDRFVDLPMTDDMIASVIVREGLLRKLDPAAVTHFVVQRVKPFMSDTEVLRLDIDMEILLEGGL